ncbi:MAG: methylmalonyl-CoA carboxyltransferase [Rhodospirillales bacterium]|jgi:methylmalonyl-CoA decarboxylase subunit alpha|nr:methylmalonyl-CoA carboxyltransferase [Rhodospirillales bacterium]MBT3904246.1 methylmalonyl-CoA carboxyltransferase [Rhodospirillaceae bacterium]MBT5034763.1 methylmalonyl-CoA carboxyltransferase [Rhodospirillaceae bacterium]MBT6218356.1 methylmalonyl-CoA carboxyltransferase [Rhodospirillaceae bacterium]MBT7769110.1 methylmalonyl-CoA carboxyltransferase [Rhodospirillales bacterium]
MSYDDKIDEHAKRSATAKAMGGPKKLERRRNDKTLNARERVERLVDGDSFRESGLFGTSYIKEMRDQTPTDGKVCGFGEVDGRQVGVVGYDFTVKGSSSSATNNKKMAHIKEMGAKRGFPIVFLSESTGVRMPDIMGEGMGNTNEGPRFLRKRESPWVSAIMGYALGSAAWHACAADFNVFRKGSVLAVSSERMVSKALGRDVTGEELGGWKVHADHTGFADAVADTDEDAIDLVKKFLSYMPSHQNEAPPVLAVPEGSDDAAETILDLIPEALSKTYDVRNVIKATVDTDSFFEIKARYAKSLTTGLARIDGHSVGFIANNPKFKGGVMDAMGCTKATSFLVLCDSYNIPVVFLQDQPGFLIGPEAEKEGVIGKVINWMNAMLQTTIPKITIIMRKSYGRGFINMGAGGTVEEIAAWWSADVSFMDPRSAVSIVHGIDEDDDPERFNQLLDELRERGGSAYDLAAVYGVKEVIDPRETRAYLKSMLKIHRSRLTGGIGEHNLSNWPTSYV